MFKPARVFPEPGTPVTKQIAFLRDVFALDMIREIQFAVSDKLIAPASDREILVTS